MKQLGELLVSLLFCSSTALAGMYVNEYNVEHAPAGNTEHQGGNEHQARDRYDREEVSKMLKKGKIPEFIINAAPVVHLYAEERYLPADIKEYVTHFRVATGSGKNITNKGTRIQDLGSIQKGFGSDNQDLFLTAMEDYSTDPDWITGVKNIPDIETGELADAPAVVIVVDKGDGIIDSFWFYFYPFNLGPFVMGGGPYGNHIGDWEHSLVRFQDGVPELVWMSAHGGGSAYDYTCMEHFDDTKRPVLFSARGTHANYATVGQHSHDIPYHMLSDFTDRGPLWDPAQNYLAYVYGGTDDSLTYGNGSVAGREKEYGDWLLYHGRWGDKKLPPDDPRQKFHPFEWRMIDGPFGPLEKNLMRRDPCQRTKWWNFAKTCRVRKQLLMGEGIEAEGGQCARIWDGIRPFWLQNLLRIVTSGGFGCWMLDRWFG